MPTVRLLSFNGEINEGKYGYDYHFIVDEKLTDFHIEIMKDVMQNYLNSISPIGELQSLPPEVVKEIINKYE